MKKRIISLILIVCVLCSLCATSVFAQQIDETSYAAKIKDINEKIEKIILDNGTVKANGMTILNEAVFINSLKSIDLLVLQNAAESQGITFDKPLTAEALAKTIKKGIKSVNDQIVEGKIKILRNGTLIKADDNNFYLQGGTTYTTYLWWGVRHYKSTDAANAWIRDLNKFAAGSGAVSVLSGILFPGAGTIITGLTAAYAYWIASDAAYVNSTTTRGIIVDIKWVLVYSIYPQ